MTDTTPAPEGVTPEQVATILKDMPANERWEVEESPQGFLIRPVSAVQAITIAIVKDAADARFIAWARNSIEALAADLARQTARADAAERERDKLKRAGSPADHALVDKYRNPKSGVFNFPEDVAAIIRRLDAAQARADALEKARDEDAKDYCALMERHDALIRRAEAAKNNVARLVGAAKKAEADLIELGVDPVDLRAVIAEVQS